MIAYFLPQFHEIPENNLWWGNGFTEWNNTKKARPLFDGHYQPRIPYNEKYYDLKDPETLEWQSELALHHGINTFCFYHYWFNGKKLLHKPMELFTKDSSSKIKFCMSWANEPWTRSWNGKKKQVLQPQEYGNQDDWVTHFNYMKEFFEDGRYLRIDDKPVLAIHRASHLENCDKMIQLWRELALKEGYAGLHIVQTLNGFEKNIVPVFDAAIEYEPMYTIRYDLPFKVQSARYSKALLNRVFEVFGFRSASLIDLIDYDYVWNRILNRKKADQSTVVYPGAFVDWDNTSRRNNHGTVFTGTTPEKFFHYMKRRLFTAEKVYGTNTLFINAWNEWAEGDYLEPDEKYQYSYLEALKQAIDYHHGNELNV